MAKRHFDLCASALALALLASGAALGDDDSSGGQQSVLVQIARLQKGSLPNTVTAYGTVEADPAARTSLTAAVAAVVGDVYVRPGQEVAKGAALLRLVPNPQTDVSYAQAVSALQNATALLTHTQELFREQLATKQDLANAQKAATDARAAAAALRRQGAAGPTILRAPTRAVVTKLSVGVGATVDVGTALVDLAPPGSLVLEVGVVPDQAAAVMAGDPARVTAVGANRTIAGKVVLRGAMVDSTTGLVPVEISLPSGALLPGQTAQASITTGLSQGYVVPHEAVLVDNNGETYVVQEVRMTARSVPVRVVSSQGNKDVIAGKLDPNAPVVLSGNYQLQDGMKIRLSNPAEK